MKNKYERTICGVGFFGEGVYKSKKEGKHTKNYSTWRSMLRRCYYDHAKTPTYVGCTVCDEWQNFQVYSEWFYETFPENKFELDKDVLSGGKGKVYSPDTCCWLPHEINSLLTERGNDRGDYPLGVTLNRNTGLYIAQLSAQGRAGGSYSVGKSVYPYEAFQFYKVAKELRVKEKARKYKDLLAPKVVEALLSYEIKDDSKWEAHLHI